MGGSRGGRGGGGGFDPVGRVKATLSSVEGEVKEGYSIVCS